MILLSGALSRPIPYSIFLAIALFTANEKGLSSSPRADDHRSQSSSPYDRTVVSQVGRTEQRSSLHLVSGAEGASTHVAPERAARTFLHQRVSELRIKDVERDLKTVRVDRVPGGTHSRLQQVYNGIPVFGADIVVSSDDRGTVRTVVDNSRSVGQISTIPTITADAAIAAARAFLHAVGPSIGTPDAAELCVFPSEPDRAALAYRVTVASENPAGDWEIFVEAHSGTILQVRDLFVMYTGAQYAQGRSSVYLSDPLSAARKLYGSPGFVDNNDKDSDSLRYYRSPVTLDSLIVENGRFVLQGPACTITNIESPEDPIRYTAASPDSFSFTRDQAGFEAVNAYYHVTNAYNRLVKLGFTSDRLRSIRVDPHGFQGQDNSHYSPTGNWIGLGTGGVDDGEDADVIWHEYAHAIIFTIVPTWGGGESVALGEGIADYWAASYSLSLNQWRESDEQRDWLYNWDGHNAFWGGRTVRDANTYPFTASSSHAGGQVVSSTLIGIRAALGRDIADRLVIKSLFYLGANAMGPDFAVALLQADNDLYGGAHIATLMHWLQTVKHFLQNPITPPAIEHTPLQSSTNVNGPFIVRAVVFSSAGIDPSRVMLFWGANRGWSDSVSMVPTGYLNEFAAAVPALGVACTYQYYIKAYDSSGVGVVNPECAPICAHTFQAGAIASGVGSDETGVPTEFALAQNYPNPFNPSTVVSCQLPVASHVRLVIYDLLGREVQVLADEFLGPGNHEFRFDARLPGGQATDLASGVYLYRLTAGSYVASRKMTLVR